MSELTQSRVKALIRYDKATGQAHWLTTRGRVRAGDEVTSMRSDGYVQIGIDGKRYMLHRVIWLYVTGAFPAALVDHKDGDKKNNRWGNLRDATKVLNAQNLRRAHTDSTHGLLGVSFIRGRTLRPFRSEIRHTGKQVSLGTFASAEAAHTAYLDAKRRLHGGNTL